MAVKSIERFILSVQIDSNIDLYHLKNELLTFVHSLVLLNRLAN